MFRRVDEQRAHIARGVRLIALVERVGVRAQKVGEPRNVLVARRTHEDLRTLRETIAERGLVEATIGIVTQVDDAAAHARADPAPRIAEHHRLAAGHVLERETAQVTPEHELGARKPDGGACIRPTLNEEPSTLSAVREAFAD